MWMPIFHKPILKKKRNHLEKELVTRGRLDDLPEPGSYFVFDVEVIGVSILSCQRDRQ